MPASVILVVPCYNEAARLPRADLLALSASRPELTLLFVDDGSSDGTAEVVRSLQAVAAGKIELLRLEANVGKGEAVRRGLVHALSSGAGAVGFADADLSTPASELLRMVRELERRPIPVLLGARVRLLGRRIERHPARHYLGRVFATLASLALRLPVYDTQCGAKLFLSTPALRAALARPFRSRWIFDVELLRRLTRGERGAPALGPDELREFPLREWRDVGSSRLRPGAMAIAAAQLLGLVLRSLVERRPASAVTVDVPRAGADERGAEGATGEAEPR